MILRRLRRQKQTRPSPDKLLPPEGVPLQLPVAGLGVRLAAQITDILITLAAALCLVIFLYALDLTSPQTIFIISTLIFFLIRTPYYAVAELLWNGQTIGKRLMKIKVVSHDGGPLSAHALVLRNLMKEAEVFLPATLVLTLDRASPLASLISLLWIFTGLLVPLLDSYRRRLGDMMAGTHVIHLPVPILLSDLATALPADGITGKKITFLSHQLDHYGAFELQTLETLLRSQERPQSGTAARQRDETVAVIVEKIRKKIGYADPVPRAHRLRFLKAFYKAQRAHLEQRQLFGDRRENKHYAQADDNGA